MAVPQVKLKCKPTPKDGVRSAHPTACWNEGIFAMSELLVTIPKDWASIIPVLTGSEYPKSSALIIRYLAKAATLLHSRDEHALIVCEGLSKSAQLALRIHECGEVLTHVAISVSLVKAFPSW